MAFKFKVKKRPNPMQTALAGLATGMAQGIRVGQENALQALIKEREEKKTRTTNELNKFRSLVAGLPQTANNRQKIFEISIAIGKGEITADEGAANLKSLDFMSDKERSLKIKEDNTLSNDPDVITEEIKTMQAAGMGGLKPPPYLKEARQTQTEIDMQVRKDPTTIDPNKAALIRKREIDINRNAVNDIMKVIKDLEEKKANAALNIPLAPAFTSEDQDKLDTLRLALPEYEEKLNKALNQDSVTNVQNNQENDPFAEFLDQ